MIHYAVYDRVMSGNFELTFFVGRENENRRKNRHKNRQKDTKIDKIDVKIDNLKIFVYGS